MVDPIDRKEGRASPQRAAAAVRRALATGRLDDAAPALLFHDLDLMRERFEQLKGSFPVDTLHAVAVKANPLLALLTELVERGAGLEVASPGELELARAAGCPPRRIVFDSPARTRPELARALELGVWLNADNFAELERIDELLAGRAPSGAIGLRINPEVGSGRIESTGVAAATSKFGVPLLQCREEIQAAFARFPWLTGLHLHSGSQGLGEQLLVTGVERVARLAAEIDERGGGRRVAFLDIGGGLPASYRPGDADADFGEYAAALSAAIPALAAGRRLITEMGRSLHAGCGWAASRVEFVKRAGGEDIAVLHFGADLMLRRAYDPASWFHELLVLDRDGWPKQGGERPFTVAGPLCFAGDILARNLLLPAVEPGDIMVARDTGAYTLAMWSRYNSREIPEVLGIAGDDRELRLRTLRRRESSEDLVRFWATSGAGSAAPARAPTDPPATP